MEPKKIKIEPAEAGEWMADGYVVECYAVVQPTARRSRAGYKRKTIDRAPLVPKSAMVTLSVEGKEPQGELGRIWKKVKPKIWGRNAIKQVSRGELEEVIVAVGGKNIMASEFIHRYATVRVVNAAAE